MLETLSLLGLENPGAQKAGILLLPHQRPTLGASRWVGEGSLCLFPVVLRAISSVCSYTPQAMLAGVFWGL